MGSPSEVLHSPVGDSFLSQFLALIQGLSNLLGEFLQVQHHFLILHIHHLQLKIQPVVGYGPGTKSP